MKESYLYHFMQTSFAQYLEEYRLSRAATLFCEKQMTISEVTSLRGYANSQTFRRAFKKHYGMLPSDYQKTVLYRQCTCEMGLKKYQDGTVIGLPSERERIQINQKMMDRKKRRTA